MPDLLGQASDWLEGQRHEHLTRPVIYKRGNSKVTVQATIGRTSYPVTNEHGILVEAQTRDYLIRAEDLVIPIGDDDVNPTQPKSGDLIIDGAVIYLVTPVSGEGIYRASDQNGRTLRIHCTQVATERGV